MAKICGAKTRSGKPCRRSPMNGTERCTLHGAGGGAPCKTGRYSKLLDKTMGSLIDRHGECDDELSLSSELAALRAVFEGYVNKVSEDDDRNLSEDSAIRQLDAIGRMVKRIEDVKANNAISQKDFYRLIEQMGISVRAHVKDEKAREKIADDWRTMKY